MKVLTNTGRILMRAGSRVRSLAPLLLVLLAAPIGAQITVVNMMPAKWPGETTQNSEPSLAINGTIPNFVVTSAFASQFHFCRYATNAPIFVSVDNGNNWQLVCVLPTASTRWPQDMTVGISSDAKALFATTLDFYRTDAGEYRMNARLFGWSTDVGRIDALKVGPDIGLSYSVPPRTTLYARGHTDQPFVRTAPSATTVDHGMVMVAENRTADGSADDACGRSVVLFSGNPWTSSPILDCLGDERPTTLSTQVIPASRAATALGVAYVIMYRPVLDGSANDVVVYKRGSTRFDALKDLPASGSGGASTTVADCDRHDGLVGKRVITCATYADVSTMDGDADFGQERRIMMDLGIAVHPTEPTKLVIAWAERSPTTPTHTALHFANSQDGGSTWTTSPWVVDHATNPTLAIASDGALGVLYQELKTEEGVDKWRTQIAISTNSLATTPTIRLLASVVATDPHRSDNPYLGDYMHLEAVGRNFYGVFAASNNRKTGVFPNLCPISVCSSQRPYNADGMPVDNANNAVPVSIDPYFFRVTRE